MRNSTDFCNVVFPGVSRLEQVELTLHRITECFGEAGMPSASNSRVDIAVILIFIGYARYLYPCILLLFITIGSQGIYLMTAVCVSAVMPAGETKYRTF